MTPRQIMGCLYFASIRQKRGHLASLALGAQAARGDPKKLNAQIKKMQREIE